MPNPDMSYEEWTVALDAPLDRPPGAVTARELAEKTGFSVDTVRRRLKRGVERGVVQRAGYTHPSERVTTGPLEQLFILKAPDESPAKKTDRKGRR